MSELIVPYFEVDTRNPFGPTTLFSVRNTSSQAVNLSVEYFDQSRTVWRHDTFDLGPRSTRSVNVRDIQNPADCRKEDCFGPDPDGFSRGWVRLSTTEPVLVGDFFQVDPANDFATGSRLIQGDGCTTYQIRFLDFGSGTDIWFFAGAPMGSDPATDPPTLTARVLDESGTVVTTADIFTDQTAFEIPVETLTTARFGTLEIDPTESVVWAHASYRADGLFSVGMDGTCLGRGRRIGNVYLLLPFFEVDTRSPAGRTTLFSVRNTSFVERTSSIEYFDSSGALQRSDVLSLAPDETLTVNVRDVPDLEVDADGMARGWARIPASEGLVGDFFQVDPNNGFATGDQLVEVDPRVPTRLREIRLLDFGSGADFWIFVENPLGEDPSTDPPTLVGTVLDEAGALVETFNMFVNEASFRLSSEELTSARFGTLLLDAPEEAGAVLIHGEYSAEGRFSVGLHGAGASNTQ